MHGTIVVKDAVLKEHPWVAGSIATAFQTAKARWLAKLKAGVAGTAADHKYLALSKIVGSDPLPFGLAANLPTINALLAAAHEQKLTPRRMTVDELFVDPA
jgi:4,5-dihydroxyphthalate decarboxylase